jgi:hypothetical protein
LLVVGDASGGGIKVQGTVQENQAGAYLYTCYSLLVAIVAQATPANNTAKGRLLTNWPDVDALPGVQGYSTIKVVTLGVSDDFTAPIGGPFNSPLVDPNDRFLLLGDPRPTVGAHAIVELEIAANVLADQYSFEGWGYYWDRAVWNTPGGPRHPGAS